MPEQKTPFNVEHTGLAYGYRDSDGYFWPIKEVDGALLVKTTGTIQIGEVEVKNDVGHPLPCYIVPGSTSTEQVLEYDEANSVASGSEVDLISYTVPGGKTLFLYSIKVSGDNVADYFLKLNGNQKEKVRTHDGSLIERFQYGSIGLKVDAGVVILVKVKNHQNYVGNFEATLFGALV